MAEQTEFKWSFHRLGGMDQVTLESADELSRLSELDPKLWAALSCPSSGLEFDSATLALLDADNDGRIRIAEVIEALQWVCRRIKNPAELARRSDTLPLASLNEENEDGARIAATARTVLKNLGLEEKDCITMQEIDGAAAIANALLRNGDGIFPRHEALDDDKNAYIDAVLSVVGGEKDASGETGINAACIDAFTEAISAEKAWRKSVADAPHPIGADTDTAWNLLCELREKVDDYFLRCRMAAFAPQSSASLNYEEMLVKPGENGLLDPDTLATLPIAHVCADQPLNLTSGMNPAWSAKAQTFFSLAAPLLDDRKMLTEEAWKKVTEAFAPYGAALAARPTPAFSASIPAENPLGALSAITDYSIDGFLFDSTAQELKDMMAEDLAVPATSCDIAELDRLMHLYTHLHRLLLNFVSFYDFYSLKQPAMFQEGTLFIDGRSCRLCLPVGDIEKHAKMAALSQLCLLYCECRRRFTDGTPEMKKNIVAAMTMGTDVFLREGRNGVYIDNEGQSWDAALVKIVHNPISIKQSVWSPYMRLSQMAGEQIAKFAGSQHNKIMTSATQKIQAPEAPKPGTPFDISKSVGIFAAVGIALGAIGTAVGSIAGMIMALHWWQFPLLFVAIFACISGPSSFMAWMKLRKRTLGPVLEASGWAVNGQLPINLKLGSALTSEASLPGNSTRTLHDPLSETSKTGKMIWAIILAVLLAAGYFTYTGQMGVWVKKAFTVEMPAEDKKDAAKADAPKQEKSAPAAQKKDEKPAPAADDKKATEAEKGK